MQKSEIIKFQENWQVPNFEFVDFFEKRTRYCVIIPVINEFEKLTKQLKRMQEHDVFNQIDVIIADGNSSDGTNEESYLRDFGVKALLIKKDAGKLSAQLRMAYAYALNIGYEGIITIDGNNKDSVESIFDFQQALDDGYDFVQGSRFVKGGKAVNTPMSRLFAIHLLHAPIVSIAARKRYTDTTNGYRAYSSKYLLHKAVQPFRNIFDTYELLAYLSIRADRIGLKTKEIPVDRVYPKTGKIPTKISFVRGNLLLLKILFSLLFDKYNPKGVDFE